MGGVSPETCWATYKYEIKFWYTVASFWNFYTNYTMINGSTSIKLKRATHVFHYHSLPLISKSSIWNVNSSGTLIIRRTLPATLAAFILDYEDILHMRDVDTPQVFFDTISVATSHTRGAECLWLTLFFFSFLIRMHGYNDLSRAKTLLSTRSRPLKIYCQHSTFYISPTTTETFILWSHFISDMNVEKTKVMRISRQSFSVKIMIDQKQLENMESFKYLSSILTNDGRGTCEIKCRIAMAEAAFIKKRTLFTSTLELELRKKLVKC